MKNLFSSSLYFLILSICTFILSSVLSSTSFAQNSGELCAGQLSDKVEVNRLIQDLNDLNAVIASLNPSLTEAELLQKLRNVYKEVFEVDLNRYDVNRIRDEGPALIRSIAQMRKRLKSIFVEIYNEKPDLITFEVTNAVQSLLRVARYAEDYIGEATTGFQTLGKNKASPSFTSGFPTVPSMLLDMRGTPSFVGRAHLRSGDVILVRGNRTNSAAIARIGERNALFSHVLVVYQHPETKQFFAVESLIEEGVIIQPLSYILNQGTGRLALYRHPDSKVAHEAARLAFETALVGRSYSINYQTGAVERGHEFNNNSVLYDFTMEPENSFLYPPHKGLFCSNLIAHVFYQASQGQIKLPLFKNRLNPKNRDFFNRIGVTATETFAPADIELDPRFELIYDWRDFRVTPEQRLRDMALDKVFEWMETYDLKFNAAPFSLAQALTQIFYYGSKFEPLAKLIEKRVGRFTYYMTKDIILTMAMLELTVKPLYEMLYKANRKSIEKSGYPLHPRDIIEKSGYPIHPRDIYELLEAERARRNNNFRYLRPSQ